MAPSSAKIKEARFIIEDEQTQVYILFQAEGDSPIGVQGWHHKTFPSSMSVIDIMNSLVDDDPLLWPQKAPE